ncbi:hypothetical protein OXX59_008320 [Metschnikowia pulcherrima]
MNVPYDFQTNKALASMESAYSDGGASKSKTHAMQMYVNSSSNSPNPQSYGVTTPSPPLRAISTRALSKNGTALVPSPLTMPQYSQQESQAQNQHLVQARQSPQIQTQRPNGQANLSQRHLQHGRQQQHQQQQSSRHHSPQSQQPQIHPSQSNQHLSQQHLQHKQFQQQQLQQHLEQSRRSAQHGYAPAEPLQKADSLHNFVPHDPQLEERQYQHSPSLGQGRPLSNGTSHDRAHQVSHIYDHDASVQDPQLRNVHHQNHHHQEQQQQSQQQQQQQQQQLAHMQLQQQLQRHQHQQLGQGQLSHHMQMGQQAMAPTNSGVHDPRLSGDMSQDHRNMHIQGGNVFQHAHIHAHANAAQSAQNLAGTVSMQQQQQPMQQQVLGSTSQGHALGSQANKALGSPALALLSKMVSNAEDDGVKKKRGRPKKLILDPATNQFIDSSHENFKKLNKLLKQNSDGIVKSGHSPMENGLRLDSLNDEEMRQLLSSKDRRGRPRKFPVEQTGITIKGVRVAGSLKGRKKESPVLFDAVNQVQKKKRGRPKGKTAAVI